MTISAGLLRAARGLLKLSHTDLSGSAVVPITAIVDYEEDVATPRPAHLNALRATLEKARVAFLDEDGVTLSGEEHTRRITKGDGVGAANGQKVASFAHRADARQRAAPTIAGAIADAATISCGDANLRNA
jgi:hypothetical protein